MVVSNNEQLKAKAMELRAHGYNCCQCIASTFAAELGLTEDAAARLSGGNGGGFGGSGELCGVLSSVGMVIYNREWRAPQDKARVYGIIRNIRSEFEARYGSCRCRDLKASRVACEELIKYGIDILTAEGKE